MTDSHLPDDVFAVAAAKGEIFSESEAERRLRTEAKFRRSEERYRTLFNSIDEGFCVFEMIYDATGQPVDYRFLEVNPAFEKHTGLADAEGRTILEMVPAHEKHWHEIYGRVAETGESIRFEERGEGMGRWFSVYAFRIDEPEQRRVAAIFSDITERKQAEEELAEAHRRKDEFLAMLAHELRSPLAPLVNMLNVLKHSEADVDLVRQATETMERQLGQMVRLVDDLLDVNRVGRDKLVLRKSRVELAPVIEQALEVCCPLAERLSHEIVVQLPAEPVYLLADRARLTQVFSNLLNNACKYTDANGRVSLEVWTEADKVVVKVADTGVGIQPDQLPHIFDMFRQASKSQEHMHGGLGIGLTLVQGLVEMHDGTVEAFSEGLGHGSEFLVRLPLYDESLGESGEEAPEVKAQAIRGRRILVVDDNVDAAESMAILLAMGGNETRTTHDGLAALAAAAEFRPDVVLLDIGLPGMSGLDVARLIRQEPWGENIALIALTGWGQEEDRRNSLEAGCNAHLVKPVEQAELMALLGRV
ncbi:PAS domain S-box-containing protein [Terrimicrobium sacchariphilum]|uniref:histidine kinase n=1 Tax=Terrimicrobium sacchariphilum TaxID=690879 RepID=A0A146GCA1_TERSA|nr:ATP-binding protein [Terrimicrobium sacchariphilum]GAT34792.1 PAS domain S-box-containing protein [Terrimicrobium sacchariphilum]